MTGIKISNIAKIALLLSLVLAPYMVHYAYATYCPTASCAYYCSSCPTGYTVHLCSCTPGRFSRCSYSCVQNTPQFSVSISPLTTAQQTLSPGDVEQYTATATGGTGSYTYTWYNATNSQQNPVPFSCSNCGQGTSSFDLVSGQTSETVALLVQVESGGAFQDSQIAYIQVGSSSTPGSGSTGGTSGTPPNLGGATNAICSVYTTVESIIFILGLTLMILGGALYAGAHVLPGQTRGSVQGYGMGMILGGVIGVIIAVAAPYVLSIATGYSISVITGACAV